MVTLLDKILKGIFSALLNLTECNLVFHCFGLIKLKYQSCTRGCEIDLAPPLKIAILEPKFQIVVFIFIDAFALLYPKSKPKVLWVNPASSTF